MFKNSKAAEKPKGVGGASNRRARFDYEILESHEAGIVLVGAEVKSIWLGRVNMTDSYCQVKDSELWVFQLDIEPYDHTSVYRPDRRRDRKLLMHKKEIDLLERKSQEKGLAIIPLKLYFKNGKVKLEVGLGRGKKEYDKRDQIQRDETRREAREIRTLRG